MALKEDMFQVQYVIESNCGIMSDTTDIFLLFHQQKLITQKYGCNYTNHWSVIYKVKQAFMNFAFLHLKHVIQFCHCLGF